MIQIVNYNFVTTSNWDKQIEELPWVNAQGPYSQTILRKLNWDFVTFGSKNQVNLCIYKYF